MEETEADMRAGTLWEIKPGLAFASRSPEAWTRNWTSSFIPISGLVVIVERVKPFEGEGGSDAFLVLSKNGPLYVGHFAFNGVWQKVG